MASALKKDALSKVQAETLDKTPFTQNINTSIIPQHRVIIHPTAWRNQPQQGDMGRITNLVKKRRAQDVTALDVLKSFSRGHCILLSDMQLDETNRMNFVSSSIFAIDVDDDHERTNIKDVLEQLKDDIVGLFYTFSHGKEGKGNRYRLVFQLDRVVTNEAEMRGIISVVMDKLERMDLPVDTNAKSPLQIVRGGNQGYELVNPRNRLKVADLLELVKEKNIKEQEQLYKEYKKEYPPIPFEKLKEMVECIGYLPTGDSPRGLWQRLVVAIKHYANQGHITQEQGYELFEVISGSEQSERSWEMLRADGRANIGSLIIEAKARGYRGKRHDYYDLSYNTVDYKPSYVLETIRVKEYIPAENMVEILQSQERYLLLDSPTGSGKTTATVNAFKMLENDSKHFYIFAAPTVSLTQQIAINHDLVGITGETKDLFKKIATYVKGEKRIFVATYDMAPALIDILKILHPKMRFTIVIDEAHKLVTDYDRRYRYNAIRNLISLKDKSEKFIGLSGTTDEIRKDEYEKVIKFVNGQPSSPCQELAIYTYKDKKDSLPELVQLIESWTKKRKMFIFIQSYEKIKYLSNVLRKKGLKVRTITAETKRNPTFKKIREQEKIDNDVNVVLATSVIADGVSIQNDLEWEVLTVCNEYSQLFNASTLKQMSNRMRKTYRRFSIYMQEPKNDEVEPFNIEGSFNWSHKIAKGIVDEINNHPYFDAELFRKSVVEEKYGIFQNTDKTLAIDTLLLRHGVSELQEKYYFGARTAFIKAVEKVFHMKNNGILDISELIREKELDLTETKSLLEELAELEKQTEKDKAAVIGQAFTHEVYYGLKNEDKEITAGFKRATIPRHFNCINSLINIVDYETCKQIVQNVNRAADTYAFYTDIVRYVEATYMMKLNRHTKTKSVLLELLGIDNFLTKEEYEDTILKITKSSKLQKAAVKNVEKMVHFEYLKGTKGARLKRIAGIKTIDYIQHTHNLSKNQVVAAIKGYLSNKGDKLLQKVILSELELITNEESNVPELSLLEA